VEVILVAEEQREQGIDEAGLWQSLAHLLRKTCNFSIMRISLRLQETPRKPYHSCLVCHDAIIKTTVQNEY
jgi:hypothetical protein